jgi:hypothetical protein
MFPPGRDRLATKPRPTGSTEVRKHYRYRAGLPVQRCSHWRARREDHVGFKADQILCKRSQLISIVVCPTNFRPQVPTVGPAQFLKCVGKPVEPSLCLRIVFAERHENTEPLLSMALLRPSRQRRRRRATEPRDELPPPHSHAPEPLNGQPIAIRVARQVSLLLSQRERRPAPNGRQWLVACESQRWRFVSMSVGRAIAWLARPLTCAGTRSPSS